jgi:alpha-glucosidase (family GH31 glycosyl hydrolase)
MRMHNMYAILYNELVFNLLRDRLGEGQAIVFARASFAGGQRSVFPPRMHFRPLISTCLL